MLLNKERAIRIMEREGLDALVATSRDNFLYFSDLSKFGWYLPTFVVLPRETDLDPWLVISSNEQFGYTKLQQSWIKDIRIYDQFGEGHIFDWNRMRAYALEVFITTLKEKGLAEAKIGIDEMEMTWPMCESIQEKLPRLVTVPAYDLIREIRMVKSEEELDRLRTAAKICDNAVKDTFAIVDVGTTETEMAQTYIESVRSQGAEPTNMVIRCNGYLGRTGVSPHNPVGTPIPFRLKKGDAIKMDFNLNYNSYLADMARSVVVGEASDELKFIYQATLDVELTVAKMVRTGVSILELLEAGVDVLKKMGIDATVPSLGWIGHGIGIYHYDAPLIGAGVDMQLEKNMVLAVEYGYGVPSGQFTDKAAEFAMEDIIVVTDNEPEFLTNVERGYELSLWKK